LKNEYSYHKLSFFKTKRIHQKKDFYFYFLKIRHNERVTLIFIFIFCLHTLNIATFGKIYSYGWPSLEQHHNFFFAPRFNKVFKSLRLNNFKKLVPIIGNAQFLKKNSHREHLGGRWVVTKQ
jgi:hypothetical protein